MTATLESSNVEGTRAALRSLIGTISVFEKAGKLYGRIGVNPMPLYRRNPSTFGVMVAGAAPSFIASTSLKFRQLQRASPDLRKTHAG